MPLTAGYWVGFYSEILAIHAVSGVYRAGCFRAASGAVKDKEPLKKAKTPQGRFDGPEEASQAALQSENQEGGGILWIFLFGLKCVTQGFAGTN